VISYLLRPRESSTGVNYAAYMHHDTLVFNTFQHVLVYWYRITINHHQPSEHHQPSTIIKPSAGRASNLQNEQFRPQNHKFNQLVASYRKRRFIYLNIFRAKTTKNNRNSYTTTHTSISSTATTHHVNESQPSPGGTTHTHITGSSLTLTLTHSQTLTHSHTHTHTHSHHSHQH
jgi:hypothetical protein